MDLVPGFPHGIVGGALIARVYGTLPDDSKNEGADEENDPDHTQPEQALETNPTIDNTAQTTSKTTTTIHIPSGYARPPLNGGFGAPRILLTSPSPVIAASGLFIIRDHRARCPYRRPHAPQFGPTRSLAECANLMPVYLAR